MNDTIEMILFELEKNISDVRKCYAQAKSRDDFEMGDAFLNQLSAYNHAYQIVEGYKKGDGGLMNPESKYYDPEGNECSLNELVRAEPDWAANVIRSYREKIEELNARLKEIDQRIDRAIIALAYDRDED